MQVQWDQSHSSYAIVLHLQLVEWMSVIIDLVKCDPRKKWFMDSTEAAHCLLCLTLLLVTHGGVDRVQPDMVERSYLRVLDAVSDHRVLALCLLVNGSENKYGPIAKLNNVLPSWQVWDPRAGTILI